jgi:hypothetical protein
MLYLDLCARLVVGRQLTLLTRLVPLGGVAALARPYLLHRLPTLGEKLRDHLLQWFLPHKCAYHRLFGTAFLHDRIFRRGYAEPRCSSLRTPRPSCPHRRLPRPFGDRGCSVDSLVEIALPVKNSSDGEKADNQDDRHRGPGVLVAEHS